MKISDCPKYETCSAPICPLDKDWKLRVLCIEDRYYVSEAQSYINQ